MSLLSRFRSKGVNNKLAVFSQSTHGVSTGGGEIKDYSIPVTKTGYVPLGIVGTMIGSGGTGTVLIYSALSNNKTAAEVRVKNVNTGALTPSYIKVDVLYQQED